MLNNSRPLGRLVAGPLSVTNPIAALRSENSRLAVQAAAGTGKNRPMDEIIGEVSRSVDAYGDDGPEDEFFGDSVKAKSLELKLREAKERESSLQSRLDVLNEALDEEAYKGSAEKGISDQKEAELGGKLDKLAGTNDELMVLVARLEQDVDDRDKSLKVLRAIIGSQKKEIKTQQGKATRYKEEERALEEETKELKRTQKKAAKVVEHVSSGDDDKTNLEIDATVDVTMETDASPNVSNVSQEGFEVVEDPFSTVAFSVTKAQDTISQWMEKLPQCVPDDVASFASK